MAWEFDTVHSEVGFAVKHMMVSTVRGRFRAFSGQIALDEARPSNSRVEVTIDTASVDTGNEMRDNHLRSPEFFDVANYPAATFVSTRVEEKGEGEYRVIGNLTLRGVTREIPLTLSVEGPHRDSRGQRRLGLTLTGALSRKEFGLSYNPTLETGGFVVGDAVQLPIAVEIFEPAAV